MKPDWKDAPEWANWLAMDEDGLWVWYEVKPEPNRYLGMWRYVRGKRVGANNDERELCWYKSLENRLDGNN